MNSVLDLACHNKKCPKHQEGWCTHEGVKWIEYTGTGTCLERKVARTIHVVSINFCPQCGETFGEHARMNDDVYHCKECDTLFLISTLVKVIEDRGTGA